MRLLSIPILGLLVSALILSFVATPVPAGNPYGGIGATVADFDASNPQGAGEPSAGMTYYQVDSVAGGRVVGYHVVVGRYRVSLVLRRLTWRELPSDARTMQAYNGYCAIYRSRWLGRVTHGPYIIVYAPTRAGAKRAHVGWPWNGVYVSVDPNCRG